MLKRGMLGAALLAAVSMNAERTTDVKDSGTVKAENQSYFSLLVDYEKAPKVKTVNWGFSVNDKKGTVSGPRLDNYCILNFTSMKKNIILESGENRVSGQTGSDVKVIAWDDPGSDLSPYIIGLVQTYKQETAYKLKTRQKSGAKISGMKVIVLDRISFLKSAISNFTADLEKLKEAVAATEKALEEMKGTKAAKETEAAGLQTEIQTMDTQIAAKEEQLNNQYSEVLAAEILELKNQRKSKVDAVQALHVETYELEQDIATGEEEIAELKKQVENYPTTIERYKTELDERYRNLAELNTAAVNDAGTSTTIVENNTTVIEKSDNDYSFGEIFGIATIPACGMALPIGMAYSTTYTEIRRPSEPASTEIITSGVDMLNTNATEGGNE